MCKPVEDRKQAKPQRRMEDVVHASSDTPPGNRRGNPRTPKAVVGHDWDGRLEDWIAAATASEEAKKKWRYRVQDWSFPTDELARECLAGIAQRDRAEVMALLRAFLFPPSTFGADQDLFETMHKPDSSASWLLETEYGRRLPRALINSGDTAQPGVRWVLDLLPDHPRLAIEVIEAYACAHLVSLAGGRQRGLDDAVSVIRAHWISRIENDSREALLALSPRSFEVLVRKLYSAMGYETELTPAGRDGGRDVIAQRTSAGSAQVLAIECKLYTSPVGVEVVRSLMGVVARDRASGGVVVTNNVFTKGATVEAAEYLRIELVNGEILHHLLNEHLGPAWPSRLDWLLREPRPAGDDL